MHKNESESDSASSLLTFSMKYHDDENTGSVKKNGKSKTVFMGTEFH